jgi:hypothetical protein
MRKYFQAPDNEFNHYIYSTQLIINIKIALEYFIGLEGLKFPLL